MYSYNYFYKDDNNILILYKTSRKKNSQKLERIKIFLPVRKNLPVERFINTSLNLANKL